jgi:osmotically-inducible protein OsmY
MRVPKTLSCRLSVVAAACAPMLCFWAAQIGAQQARSASGGELQEIIVIARKVKSDEEVTRQVETALHSNPYIFDEHITVTTRNGVVTLHGIALDYWDVFAMQRLVRKMAGVKRVVNDIDVRIGGD